MIKRLFLALVIVAAIFGVNTNADFQAVVKQTTQAVLEVPRFLPGFAGIVEDEQVPAPPTNVVVNAPAPVIGGGGFTCDITATTNSVAAVQAAHDDSSLTNGETLCIPAGTATWASQVTISKAITIRGATNCTVDANDIPTGTGACSTVIRSGVPFGVFLGITTVTGQLTRVSNLEFNNNGGAPNTNGIMYIFGDNGSERYRVDHIMWDNVGSSISFNKVYGVLDHSYIRGGRVLLYRGYTGGDGSGDVDPPWSAPPRFGVSTCNYIENNKLDPSVSTYAVADAWAAACYVGRYNTVINGWWELHGTDSAGRARGTREVELYHNTHTCAVGCGAEFANLRSGTVIGFENTVTGTGYVTPTSFILSIQRIGGAVVPWGQANGASEWDLNSGGNLVYALDQPCRGQDSGIVGVFPNPPTHPGWANGQMDQITEFCYEWNNTENGNNINFVNGEVGSPPALDSTIYRNDVTQGARTSRPTSGLTIGDGWWSTDQGGNWQTLAGGANDGCLDKAISSTSWQDCYYTPLPFPHYLTATP